MTTSTLNKSHLEEKASLLKEIECLLIEIGSAQNSASDGVGFQHSVPVDQMMEFFLDVERSLPEMRNFLLYIKGHSMTVFEGDL